MADLQVNSNPINYTQELTLDLNSNNAYTTVFAKQYDNARYLKIYLAKDNIPYEIDPTHNFYFRMRKPDGHGVINPAFVQATIDNGFVIVELTQQCLASAGRGYADLVEYDGNGSVLSSIPFILNIMSSPNLGDNITSSDEFQQLVEMVSQGEALLENAPKIRASDKHWIQYAVDSSTGDITEYDTGVVAEGKDGVDGEDGASFHLVDVKTGLPDTPATETITSVVFANTSYWNNSDFNGDPAGHVNKTMAVVGDSSTYKEIIINNITYYVKPQDVHDSDEKNSYYVITIPKGEKGDQGEKGDKGERGAAGAGGVTWVDGIQPESELHFETDVEAIASASLDSAFFDSDIKTVTFTNPNNFTYNEAKDYVGVAFSVNHTTPSTESIFPIDSWIAQDTADFENLPPTGVVLRLRPDEQPEIPANTTIYLYGRKGIFSGNVRVQAVSYAPQSKFIGYDEYGAPLNIEINDNMRAAARANIGAMANIAGTTGDVVAFNTRWGAEKPYNIVDFLSYSDLSVVCQKYEYALSSDSNEG